MFLRAVSKLSSNQVVHAIEAHRGSLNTQNDNLVSIQNLYIGNTVSRRALCDD